MFWSAISSSSNFHYLDFVNQFISFFPLLGGFEIKLNYAYIRLPHVLQVSLALVVEQMEVLECLSFFVKTMVLGIFGVLQKLKSLIQKTGPIDSWVRLGLLYFPREVFDIMHEDLLCDFYSLPFKVSGKVLPVILILLDFFIYIIPCLKGFFEWRKQKIILT